MLAEIDLLLVMTVEPGFGGQAFLEMCLPKIRRARELVSRSGLEMWLQVDGGVSAETIERCAGRGRRRLRRRQRRVRCRRPGGRHRQPARARGSPNPRLDFSRSTTRAPGSVKLRTGGDSPRPGRRPSTEGDGRWTRWNSGTDGDSPDGRKRARAAGGRGVSNAPRSCCVVRAVCRRVPPELALVGRGGPGWPVPRRSRRCAGRSTSPDARRSARSEPAGGLRLAGCHGGIVVAEGYHRGAGNPHAEVEALRAAGDSAAWLYRSCHPRAVQPRRPDRAVPVGAARSRGRPCRLRAARRESSWLGVAAKNFERLASTSRAACWPTRHGTSTRSGRSPSTTGRPFVTWKFAATLDGRSAAADGTSQWITSPEARADVHRLRAEM